MFCILKETAKSLFLISYSFSSRCKLANSRPRAWPLSPSVLFLLPTPLHLPTTIFFPSLPRCRAGEDPTSHSTLQCPPCSQPQLRKEKEKGWMEAGNARM